MEISEELLRQLIQNLRDEFNDRVGVVEDRSIAAYNMAATACEALDICVDDAEEREDAKE